MGKADCVSCSLKRLDHKKMADILRKAADAADKMHFIIIGPELRDMAKEVEEYE